MFVAPPPRRPVALTLLATLLGTLWAPAGCRSPRDPDLEQQLARARAGQQEPVAAEEPPPPPPAAPVRKATDEPAGAPPVGVIELRTYGDEEIEEILASVPGTGPVFSVHLETGAGDIHCQLDVELAPQTTANFIALADGLKAWRDPDTEEAFQTRFYDGLTFHRTISNFIIQTGNPGTRAASGPGWKIPREDGNPARFEAAGAMGMVDASDDTHGSQFFITLRAQKTLVGKYTPFGLCSDLDVVKAIADADKHPPATAGKSATKPLRPVRVSKVTVTRGPAAAPEPAAP